jgi:hypothetical protein
LFSSKIGRLIFTTSILRSLQILLTHAISILSNFPFLPQAFFAPPSSPTDWIASSIAVGSTISSSDGALTTCFSTPVIEGLAELEAVEVEEGAAFDVVGDMGSIHCEYRESGTFSTA